MILLFLTKESVENPREIYLLNLLFFCCKLNEDKDHAFLIQNHFPTA